MKQELTRLAFEQRSSVLFFCAGAQAVSGVNRYVVGSADVLAVTRVMAGESTNGNYSVMA